MKLSMLSFYYTFIKSTTFHVGQHSKQLQNIIDKVSIYDSKEQVCAHMHARVCVCICMENSIWLTGILLNPHI